MKNFARIIDLGTAECCVHRRSDDEVVFDFWMRNDREIISPTASKSYQFGWVVDRLFDGQNEALLREVAQEVLDVILHQMALHEEHIKDRIPFVLDGDLLNLLHSDDAD